MFLFFIFLDFCVARVTIKDSNLEFRKAMEIPAGGCEKIQVKWMSFYGKLLLLHRRMFTGGEV